MQLPNDSLVLVADGRKSLFFRNEGDAEFPNLAIEDKAEQINPATRNQGTDEPGSTFSSSRGDPRTGGYGDTMGAARSAYSETDIHQQEEDRFAAEIAETLKTRALANEYEALVIVAPPRTLGELRKHYHKEVERRILGEVSKDLVNMPLPEIEQVLKDA